MDGRPHRPRSASTLSSASTPSLSSPLARRSRPPALQLSPSGSSIAPSALSSPRYQSFSLAPSQAGSAATVSNATSTRFKRGHARGKTVKEGVATKSANPDEVDLMALEDPDELFRLFGVRDVRGLEKRSRDAADAKVADLRTMVGERYRDLLSAADSIVRMRTAAEKLVDRLDNVEARVSITPDLGSPVRRPSAARHSISALDTPDPSLSSPPTLSLTIHLLLSLPSLVHTFLESSSFLPAARIEGVGRVVYRELSNYSLDEAGNERENLMASFPIIEKNWESISSLGGVIVRRSKVELRNWGATSQRTAETLVAIIMLETTALPSALTLLLDARSKALTSVLSPSVLVPRKRQNASHEIDTVLKVLSEAIGVVLRTVEVAKEIFGLDGEAGLLIQLLEEIENPSGRVDDAANTGIKLAPTLSTLPNYPLLKRHLPSAILNFTPFLSITSARNIFSPVDASAEVEAWLARSTDLVVVGVASWISTLPGGAQTLSLIRNAIRSSLSLDAGSTGVVLRKRLEETVENCLDGVYKELLRTMVSGVSTNIATLLSELDGSKADLNPAEFLIRGELPFPSAAMQPKTLARSSTAHGKSSADPFEVFLERVMKRVDGRSPLVDRGVLELEGQAKRLREDLAGWLIVDGGLDGAREEMRRLRSVYFVSAKESLEAVHEALSTALQDVATDPRSSLFIGSFALALSKSSSFTRNLLLSTTGTEEAAEIEIVKDWQDRLTTLQAQSLTAWKSQALVDAIGPIEKSMTAVTAPLGMSWDWEASRGLSNGSSSVLSNPSQPSSFILASLRSLSNSIRQIGPHRTLSDPSIVPTLLGDYRTKCAIVVRSVLAELAAEEKSEGRRNKAVQGSWDMRFLGRFWEMDEEWERLRVEMMALSTTEDESTSTAEAIEQSTLAYLQRTQTIFSPLLPSSSTPATNPTSQLLPLGLGPTSDFKSTIGVVKTGVRLGLLPTRG